MKMQERKNNKEPLKKERIDFLSSLDSITPAMLYIAQLNHEISQSRNAKKDVLMRVRENLINLYNLPKQSRKGGPNDC
jgi:hypothetical protein